MSPYYTPHHQECEQCDDEILIGYECLIYDNMFFCDKECLANHLIEGAGAREIYLEGWRK